MSDQYSQPRLSKRSQLDVDDGIVDGLSNALSDG